MGNKSQPAPVPVPNPERIIAADANANRINQATPFGSLTFSGPNRSNASFALSPELDDIFQGRTGLDRELLGLASGAAGGLGDLVNNPLSTEGLPDLFTGDQGRSRAEGAFFDRGSALLNRQFDRDENRLRNTLANQGIQTDSNAGSREFSDFNLERNDAFGRLANDSVLFGGNEARSQLASDLEARSGLFNERAALRGNQFGELGNLLNLQQTAIPQLNNFFGPGGVNAADAFGLQQSVLQNNFNAQSNNARSAKGGAAGLIGTLGGGLLAGPAGAQVGGAITNGFFGNQKGRG